MLRATMTASTYGAASERLRRGGSPAGAAVGLVTEDDRLTPRSHEAADAENLRRLLTKNAEHLMSWGDHRDEIATTVAKWRERFAVDSDGRAVAHSFGMWLDEREMVGRIVLVPVDPSAYGMGYWVTNPQQGKGFASASVIAIVGHAAPFGATEVFAGVSTATRRAAACSRSAGSWRSRSSTPARDSVDRSALWGDPVRRAQRREWRG
jgi:RimJ/RimL family protein N-acetyltransferase